MKGTESHYPVRLLTVFTSGLLILLLLLIFGFFRLVHNASQEQVVGFSQKMLQTKAQHAETISLGVKDVFDSACLDPTLSKLLNYEKVEATDLLNGLRQLNTYRENNFFIDSIYIYNYINKQIYVSSANATEAVYSIEDFYDQDAVAYFRSYQDYHNMSPIFRTLTTTYPKMDDINVVSYLRYNTLALPNQSSVLIINVNLSSFFELPSTWETNPASQFLFVDRNGVIGAQTASGADNPQSLQAMINRVLHSSNDEGFLIDRAAGAPTILCYRSIFNNEWLLLSVSDEYDLYALLGTSGYTASITVFVLFFAACTAGIVFAFKKISDIGKSNRQKIARMELEGKERAYESSRRSLLEFLHSSVEPTPLSLLTQHGFSASSDADARVIILYLDRYATQIALEYERVSDRAALKHEICNAASSVLSSVGAALISYEEDARCFALLQPAADCGEWNAKLVTLQALVRERLHVSLSILLSPAVTVSQIPNAYQALCQMLPYRQLFGIGKIISNEMLQQRELQITPEPQELIKRMTQDILQLDMPRAMLSVQEILDFISAGSYRSFQTNLARVLLSLDDALIKLQVNNGVSEALHTGTLIYDVCSLEDVAEIYEIIEKTIRQAEQSVLQNKNAHQQELFVAMRRLVQENYMDRDFSINTIAEKMQMSAGYLGRLFKKSTGTTFLEYLLSVRMEVARNLLTNANTPIDEIVRLVGFGDTPYFYKVFKKVNGCTPASYRKNHAGCEELQADAPS